MKVWITYFVDSYSGETFIDKVFNDEEKAKRHIEFKDEMTGHMWSYFDKDVE
ncbi:hypothetical protein [Alkalihalobacillus trypoxylicola]|uniref:hypothetical protein n=1 Tax=Alkalihalobacillus trypoxylicola TaxID=519424 RepID=UPI000AA76C8A|nr:hypothetical protein [Alkalihalobacillus trypoxylicola]